MRCPQMAQMDADGKESSAGSAYLRTSASSVDNPFGGVARVVTAHRLPPTTCTCVYTANPILFPARAQKQLAKFKMAKISFALEFPRSRRSIVQIRGLNLARGRQVAFWPLEILALGEPAAA
jgi:hypothetical protein